MELEELVLVELEEQVLVELEEQVLVELEELLGWIYVGLERDGPVQPRIEMDVGQARGEPVALEVLVQA